MQVLRAARGARHDRIRQGLQVGELHVAQLHSHRLASTLAAGAFDRGKDACASAAAGLTASRRTQRGVAAAQRGAPPQCAQWLMTGAAGHACVLELAWLVTVGGKSARQGGTLKSVSLSTAEIAAVLYAASLPAGQQHMAECTAISAFRSRQA